MKVEKRDGTIQDFDFGKIEKAVTKVFTSKPVCEQVPKEFMKMLREHFDNLVLKQDTKDPNYAMPIERIQDTIRDLLIKKNKTKAAESFILYRNKREEIREKNSWLTKEIGKKLNGTNIENQNANVDEASFGGRMGEANRVVTKDYALKNLVSKMAKDNHNNNMIYIHDLDSYAVGMHNCLSIPFDDLLANGFKTRQTDVRPANSVNTACQLVAVIFQIQSLQQFGGVSATHLDWTMVPYIRKSFYKHFLDGIEFLEIEFDTNRINHNTSIDDNLYIANTKLYKYAIKMTEKETKQAVEGLFHNLNTLQSRSGKI